ncbi:MAG: tyrosine recombinase XerC [Oleiphilaceae bacterium]|nr:tyrosine recombinase XerC [Oleiphilaceae bacterium]
MKTTPEPDNRGGPAPSDSAAADPRLRAPLESFLHYLRTEKRQSPHTLSGYRRDLCRLVLWMSKQGHSHWQQLTHHRLRYYVASLAHAGLQGRSIARHLSAIRRFLGFLIREGTLKDNPALDVRPPRGGKGLPKVMDVDSLSRTLNQVPEDVLEIRDLAMLELLYSSGLRLAELVSLDLNGGLNLAGREVKVLGKGNKERLVPVGRLALEALELWLAVRDQLAPPGEVALFVSQRGRRIHHRTVQQRLRRWGVQHGAEQGLHPHLMRHSFASHMLESSGDLRAVQELLGHADISTTQVYTHLDFQHLSRVYDKAHPRAQRRRRPGASPYDSEKGTGP